MELQSTTAAALAPLLEATRGHPAPSVLCCGQVTVQLDNGLGGAELAADSPAAAARAAIASKRFLCVVDNAGLRLVPCLTPAALAADPGLTPLGATATAAGVLVRPLCQVFIPGRLVLLHAKARAPASPRGALSPAALYLQLDQSPDLPPLARQMAASATIQAQDDVAAGLAAWQTAGVPPPMAAALSLARDEVAAVLGAEEVHVVPCAAGDGGTQTVDSLFDACCDMAAAVSANSTPTLAPQEGGLGVVAAAEDEPCTFYTGDGETSLAELLAPGRSGDAGFTARMFGFGGAGEGMTFPPDAGEDGQARSKRGRNE